MRRIAVGVALAVALGACATAKTGPAAAPADCPSPEMRRPPASPGDSPHETSDDHRARVAQEVPEFGGIYVDPKTKSWVVLVTDGSQETATRAKIAYERVTGASRDVSLADYAPVPRAEKATRSFWDLYRWYRPAVDEVMAAMEVRTTGIDEVRGRLHFGVADPQQNRDCVDAALARLGIPADAYAIEETAPIVFG